jgi:hypothetical protein
LLKKDIAKQLLSFAGTIPVDDLKAMEQRISVSELE